MSRERRSGNELLLGEWACLGILLSGPSHGFAIAQELSSTSEVGRVWSLTRPLTYRALEQLQQHGYVEVKGEEPGIAGGNRTRLSITRSGRAAVKSWLESPVLHLRDLRSELLLKLTIAQRCELDTSVLVKAQIKVVSEMARGLESANSRDVVGRWRHESAEAALRFLKSL